MGGTLASTFHNPLDLMSLDGIVRPMTTSPDPPPRTTTTTAALVSWLAAHPGEHRPVDIARATGLTTHTVASRLIHLADHGKILRRRVSRSSSLYSSPR